ncbi:phage tail protein [Clostridiaceae bacterium AF42-6]|nr:phage tail protein [Clostridiaceae bacterium AF42-6]
MAKVYKTKSGDTWDIIAKEVYGDELYTSFLMGNNQQYLDYFVFPEGVLLEIKDKPDKDDDFLPDWRQ